MCVRLSAERIHGLYELQRSMTPPNAAVQLQLRSLYVSRCQGIYRSVNLVCIDLQVVVALTELLKVSVVFSGYLSFNKITED